MAGLVSNHALIGPDGDGYWENARAGMSVGSEAGVVTAIFLHGFGKDGFAQFPGPLPGGLKFEAHQEDVRRAFGNPESSGGPAKLPGAFNHGGWDRYAVGASFVHFTYRADDERIELVTLMPQGPANKAVDKPEEGMTSTPAPLWPVAEFYQSSFGNTHSAKQSGSKYLPDLRLLSFQSEHLGASFTVVVTLGMRSRPMNVPAATALRRAELLCYLPPSLEDDTWWLSWIAELPFIDNTWLGHGHTIAMEQPLFEGSALQHLLLLPSFVRTHRDMEGHVSVDGDPVGLWWVVPISQSELEYKRARGVDALLDAFDEKDLPLVLDPARPSTV